MDDHDGREKRLEVPDQFRARLPGPSEEEVTADADEAVRDIRREHARQGTDDPVRVEKTPIDGEEMGGEAPCQLHRFWDVEE